MESSMKQKHLLIGGMTCLSCQNKIEKKLKSTAGIKSASVSYSAGTADIAYDPDIISLKDIAGVIERLNYKVLSGNERAYPNIRRIAGLLAIIVSLYALLTRLGILNLLVPSRLADAQMGFGMLFVIGLLTSVHCIAMCGGINLSQCIPRGEAGLSSGSRMKVLRPAILYNLGRVVSYTVVGFLLGAAGSLFGGGTGAGLPVMAQGILKLAAGVFMVIMGINMLGLFPGLRKLQPRMPRFIARNIGAGKAKASSPLLVGLLNGLMPCGPLQSMQIVALASGNPLAGALSMFMFSLGTVPLMLGLGSIVSALGMKFTKKVMTVGAVLVVVLGLAMLSQGGSLSGLLPPDLLLPAVIGLCLIGIASILPYKQRDAKKIGVAAASLAAVVMVAAAGSGMATGDFASPGSASDMVGGKQVIKSTLSSGRYPNITVQAGSPVKWIIQAPEGSVNGCNYQINIPEYDINRYEFKTGENVIEFTPTRTGRFQYSCWMGMIRGTITVTEADAKSAEEATAAEAGDSVVSSPFDFIVMQPVPAGYVIPSNLIAIAEETLFEGTFPVQEISVKLTKDGFSPAVVVVKSGLDVIWNIDNLSSDAELLVPNYAASLTLTEGENQFSFNPDASFEFSTGDNAFYGYVKVVNDLESVDLAAIKSEIDSFETLIYPPDTFQKSGAGYEASDAVYAELKDGVQYVTSTVSNAGYEPIRVREGIPVKWTISMPGDVLNSCNNAIYIPVYEKRVDLKAGDNLIEFTPEKSGNYVFSCWMGMIYGSITVEREDGSVDDTQDDGSGSLPSCCS